MTHFSERTNWPSHLNPLSEKLAQLKREGAGFMDLTESNPTRCGFSFLEAPLLSALTAPQSLRYEPDPRGLLRAREAVCGYYERKGIRLNPEQIFLTSSTSEAYHYVFRLLAGPGDAVLAPKPSYPLFEYLAGLSDVVLKTYALSAARDWRTDSACLEAACPEPARAVILVHPNNPTGHFVTAGERKELDLFCRRRSAALICDEVFLDYALHGGEVQSFADNQETLTFTLSGISKILGLPQMKLSWIVVNGPEAEREEALRRLEIIADAYLSVNAPVQNALSRWFELQPRITEEIRLRLSDNLETLQEAAGNQLQRVCLPQGGWYAALRLPASREDEAWAMEFLEQDGVLIHPGYLFDFEEPAPFGVISLLPEPEKFKAGVKKIFERMNA